MESSGRLKISMFVKLSGKEKRLFLEAFVLHLWVGLMLKFVPFRRIPGLFGSPQSSVGSLRLLRRRRLIPAHEVSGQQSPVGSLQSSAGDQLQDIMMVKRAIERANVVSPWRNRCLISSLAARRILAGRGIESQLSLGVAKDAAGRTLAHAWLSAGDKEIVSRGSGYTELYFF